MKCQPVLEAASGATTQTIRTYYLYSYPISSPKLLVVRVHPVTIGEEFMGVDSRLKERRRKMI